MKKLLFILFIIILTACEKPIVVPSVDDVYSDSTIVRDHVTSTMDGQEGNCVNCHN